MKEYTLYLYGVQVDKDVILVNLMSVAFVEPKHPHQGFPEDVCMLHFIGGASHYVHGKYEDLKRDVTLANSPTFVIGADV